MLRNYLTIAIRNLRRNAGYTAINLIGLAVGIACCFLIALYVRHEFSYDDFHEKADRIYRVVEHGQSGERTWDRLMHSALLAPALKREFSGVDEAVRISQRWGEGILVRHGDRSFYEDRFFFADSAFFDVFSFPMAQGHPETALAKPFSVVITERVAQKYFGEENPIGQTLRAKGYNQIHELTVTGVIQNPPSTSHFQFDFLVSFNTLRQTMPRARDLNSWAYFGHYTYVLLEEEAGPKGLETALPAFVRERKGEAMSDQSEGRGVSEARLAFQLQPVTDIHLHSHYDRELAANSDIRYVYIFSVLALLILGIACINYMNLATAQSARRAQEVGVRKTIGAYRHQLTQQFLGESALLCSVALVGALVLARLALPVFNDITGVSLSVGFFTQGNVIMLLGIGVVVALVSGSYPAFYLSAFRPVQVLKGTVKAGPTGARFRKGLVVFQFVVAVALIAGTILTWQQLRHMQTKRLGLNEEQVVAIHARHAMRGNYQTFKQELLQQTGVDGVTGSNDLLPTTRPVSPTLVPEGVDEEQWLRETNLTINQLAVDRDFMEVMEIPLAEGRGFSEATVAEDVAPVLINETAARALGWEEPIGKTFRCCHFRDTPRVVGVVEDFHYQTLRQHIQPLVLVENTYAPQYVMARVQSEDLSGALDALQAQWGKVSDAPFEYSFLDRRFDQVYRAEQRMSKSFQVFAGLAIFIACLGLLGLAAYAAERRTKEIGIRKALGATAAHIVALLSKEFLLLVGVACVVATPLAYFGMQRWLQDFAYRIDVSPWLFVAAGGVAAGVAMATIGYHALRAARTDPAEALRYE